VRLNLSEVPLKYGIMTVSWYVVSEEGRLLLGGGFVMESTNPCGFLIKSRTMDNVQKHNN
jgi:hypothetical protein